MNGLAINHIPRKSLYRSCHFFRFCSILQTAQSPGYISRQQNKDETQKNVIDFLIGQMT